MEPPPALLFLIGYRGTGKSTVARLVAQRLGWEWVDADDELERAAGKAIAEIFADDGEPAFRDLEQQVMADLCARQGWVVALGGGAVLREANRERLRDAGPAVWLTARPETLARRLAADESTGARRPGLTAAGTLAEIHEVLAARTPLYRDCATFEVDTEGKSPEDVALEVASLLSLDK